MIINSRATTRKYFRIQPAGLGIDHLSETSAEEPAEGLHVFLNASEVESPDVPPENYGDEVLVIEADHHWSNGDVEGVCIDGKRARIARRIPLADFRASEWE